VGDQQTSRSARLRQLKIQPTRHCRSFDVLSLVFDAVGVAVFIVYHLVLSAGQALQNQIRIQPQTVSVHLTDPYVGKLSDFDNVRIRTLSHQYMSMPDNKQ